MNIALAKEIATALCIRWESVRLKPYLCPAGVPTIGIGAIRYEDGTRVTLTDPPITLERAKSLLEYQLDHTYIPDLLRLCPNIDTPRRMAAMIDFIYNLGGNNLKNSNLRRKINAGVWDQVPAELLKWNKGGGHVLVGLTRRRQAEASLI